jgi:hypothetical protein
LALAECPHPFAGQPPITSPRPKRAGPLDAETLAEIEGLRTAVGPTGHYPEPR